MLALSVSIFLQHIDPYRVFMTVKQDFRSGCNIFHSEIFYDPGIRSSAAVYYGDEAT